MRKQSPGQRYREQTGPDKPLEDLVHFVRRVCKAGFEGGAGVGQSGDCAWQVHIRPGVHTDALIAAA